MVDRADRIEHQGNAFVVLSEAGEELARFTGPAAEKQAGERLRQIEAAKAAKGDEAPKPVTVRRYDRGRLTRRPRRDSSTGALLVDASVTRAPAVFRYRLADGTVRREFRPADQVFSADNRERMGRSPVTLGHPKERVTTKNIKRLCIGHAHGAVEVRDGHGFVSLVIDDEGGIDALNGGLDQTSCGYDCDLVMDDGVFTDDAGVDHPFDAIQTNHKNNHIALCHEGRAGTTRVLMDSLDRTDAIQIGENEMPNETTRRDDPLSGPTGRVTLDNDLQVELPITTATAVSGHVASLKTSADVATKRGDTLEAERDDLKSKHDALEAERDDLKAKLEAAEKQAKSDEDIQLKVDARIKFLETARPHFKDDEAWGKVKDLVENEIRKAAVAAAKPDLALDAKSDDYISAAFDLLEVPSRSDAADLAGAALGSPSREDDTRTEDNKRVDEAMRKHDEAWKYTVPGSITQNGKTTKPEQRARF